MKRWLVSISVMLLRGNLVDVGQQAFDGSILERLVHRQVDLGIGHDFVKVFADFSEHPSRQSDHREPTTEDRGLGIDGREHGARNRLQVDRNGSRTLGDTVADSCQLKRLLERCVETRSGRTVRSTECRNEGRSRSAQLRNCCWSGSSRRSLGSGRLLKPPEPLAPRLPSCEVARNRHRTADDECDSRNGSCDGTKKEEQNDREQKGNTKDRPRQPGKFLEPSKQSTGEHRSVAQRWLSDRRSRRRWGRSLARRWSPHRR